MKKIVSLVLALSMVLSMFTTAFAGTSMEDIEGTDYEAAVSALVELGVVEGFPDGTYRPKEVVTRAQMAKLLVVSAGLEPAADVAKGATNFTDVSADHWASGYINVASQYGFINGYPDGTFNPDATVTYAEAVTMAIRVLGYKSVVEAKGTWPTNYIAKAQELKVLKDVKYGSYTDGAERGKVSLLIWNMLRTEMWDVDSESEKDGLTYSKNGNTMIDKYFEDYEYIDEDNEYVVTNIEVDDGKVTVDLESEEKNVYGKYDIELGKNTDFLNLLGRKVSGLYNTKDEEIVVLVASSNDTVKADYKDELDKTLDGDYKFTKVKEELTWGKNSGLPYDYTVAVIGSSKNVDYSTSYKTAESYVVKETKMSNDILKITTIEDSTKKITEENAIVLIDGEWATREDIKAGDVVTALIENELYVVNREQVTGKFQDASNDFIKVDGEKYEQLLTNKLFELVDEDKEKYDTVKFDDLDKDSKYFDEECTVYVNFLGEVVRVEFEEITDEDDGNFYVLTNVPGSWTVSDKSGSTQYVELNGESYELKSSATISGVLASGSIVFATFDKKDRVVAIEVIQSVSGDTFYGDAISTTVDDDEKYAFANVDKEIDDNYLDGSYKVSTSTTVYTITPVEDDDDDIVGYEVEISKGQNALKGIEESVVAYKQGSKVASYVFVLEDAKNTDIEFGIIDEDGVQSGKKTQQVTIDGKTYTIDEDEDITLKAANEGNVIAFNDDTDGIRIKDLFKVSDLMQIVDDDHRIVVDEEDSRMFVLSGDKSKTYDLDNDDYEDTTFVVVTYDMDDNEFTSVDTYTAEKVSVDDDYIWVGNRGLKDTIYIVKGYDFDYVGDDVVEDPVDDTTTKYTISFYLVGEDEDTLWTTKSVAENGSVRVNTPTKDNMTFDHWEDEAGNAITTFPVATADAKYYAYFTAYVAE